MWPFIFFGIVGCGLVVLVAAKPRIFWEALIFFAVFSAGFMIRHFNFIDEYFVGCILFGGLLAIFMRAVKLKKKPERNIWEFLHKWLFFLFTIYMATQSLRGMFFLGGIMKIRWFIFFAMLFWVSFLITKKNFLMPRPQKICLVILLGSLGYLIIYLLHGISARIMRGVSWQAVQLTEWSTPAYALFLIVITIPCALFFIRENRRSYRRLGWLCLIISFVAAFFYSSRIAILVILGFCFIFFVKFGIRRVALLLFTLLIIFNFFFPQGKINVFFGELPRLVRGIILWDESAVDIDRKMHLQVSFASISSNWKNFLFGYGFRTHGLFITPHLKNAYIKRGLRDTAAKLKPDQSTEGFTALLVDTGIIGLLLLLANFALVSREILVYKKNRYRFTILASLIFAFLWLPVINLLDIMLFYFLIMPNGLLIQLNRYSIEYDNANKK